MKQILKFIRRTIELIGALSVFFGITTSDYYVLELEQNEPNYIWGMMIGGFIMILIAVVLKIFETDN